MTGFVGGPVCMGGMDGGRGLPGLIKEAFSASRLQVISKLWKVTSVGVE